MTKQFFHSGCKRLQPQQKVYERLRYKAIDDSGTNKTVSNSLSHKKWKYIHSFCEMFNTFLLKFRETHSIKGEHFSFDKHWNLSRSFWIFHFLLLTIVFVLRLSYFVLLFCSPLKLVGVMVVIQCFFFGMRSSIRLFEHE